ncbi:MAG: hypothetical protein ACYCXW_06280 [Solirubrobacteraceae bacterium]
MSVPEVNTTGTVRQEHRGHKHGHLVLSDGAERNLTLLSAGGAQIKTR